MNYLRDNYMDQPAEVSVETLATMNYATKIIWDNAWLIRQVANISELYLLIDGQLVKTP